MTTEKRAKKERPKRLVNLLSDVPAIDRYLDRIGAKAKSPRTATITSKVEGSYERDDIALIKLAPDGTWHVPDSLAPTEEEEKEIAAQIGDYQWPTLVKQERPTLPQALTEARKANPMNVFEFRDTSGKIVMFQQRIDDKDGVGKKYIPWTLWSDGKWRECEPDEALPLWGLEQLKHHSMVFLHEGAKGARQARRIASLHARKGEPVLDHISPNQREHLLRHPWAEELAHAAHIGWIGGAPNPHRTDWSPLKRGVVTVFIVADNDTLGVDAVRKISRELSHWNIPVYDIRFDSRFPHSFDLGDDFFHDVSEGKLWDWREPPVGDGAAEALKKRYIGPSMRELLGPATWAVEEVAPKPTAEKKPGPKKPIYRLRKVFRDQWVVAKEMKPVHFINRWDPSRLYVEENFNKKNRPFSGPVSNLSNLLLGEHSAEIDLISYEPGRPRAELNVRGKRTFNTWTPSLIQPVSERHYNPQPWLEFLEHLFPVEEERRVVMRWCATLIARPDIRMTFGLLLVSERHGIGKTTLAKVLSVLVGEHNTSWPSESQIVDSQFNSWLARKRLVVCNEIYSGHSWTAYKKLKSVISDMEIEVNEKHIATYTINNWSHVILCSNSDVPVNVEEDDRRIYQPRVTEIRKPPVWWSEFHKWLASDGYSIILEWARRYVGYIGWTGRVRMGEVEPIGPEMHPPMTEMKRRLIEASTDEDQKLARSLGEQAVGLFSKRKRAVILVDREVQSWVANRLEMSRKSDPKGWKRSFSNVRRGLARSGMVVARKWRLDGYDQEAYANFVPTGGWEAKANDAAYWRSMVERKVMITANEIEPMVNADDIKAWVEG